MHSAECTNQTFMQTFIANGGIHTAPMLAAQGVYLCAEQVSLRYTEIGKKTCTLLMSVWLLGVWVSAQYTDNGYEGCRTAKVGIAQTQP